MTIELTPKQEEGLRTAVQRFRDGERYTVISGYAGSGKSTLIKFIVAALGFDDLVDVGYVAYTGKAANVLKQKGCVNATTAHKLLYYARPTKDGTYIFVEKETLENPYKLIVVDEVSMLPSEMWNLLLSHGVYVIACGDPGQLPPINPEDNNHVLDNPHIFLDQIMRQAQESEIIRLSMHIREGEPLSTFQATGAQVQIIDSSQLVTGMYTWADQILCATNKKRNEINGTLRKIKGYEDAPCVGDKIISLKNHWDIFSNAQTPLTNGSIGYITKMAVQDIWVPKYIYEESRVPIIHTNIKTEDDEMFEGLCLDYNSLALGQKTLTPKQEYMMSKNKRCINPPFEFVYGYGITTHKAQGSEWPRVLVFEENFPFDKEEHMRWLYTSITRASEKLVIVRK